MVLPPTKDPFSTTNSPREMRFVPPLWPNLPRKALTGRAAYVRAVRRRRMCSLLECHVFTIRMYSLSECVPTERVRYMRRAPRVQQARCQQARLRPLGALPRQVYTTLRPSGALPRQGGSACGVYTTLSGCQAVAKRLPSGYHASASSKTLSPALAGGGVKGCVLRRFACAIASCCLV